MGTLFGSLLGVRSTFGVTFGRRFKGRCTLAKHRMLEQFPRIPRIPGIPRIANAHTRSGPGNLLARFLDDARSQRQTPSSDAGGGPRAAPGGSNLSLLWLERDRRAFGATPQESLPTSSRGCKSVQGEAEGFTQRSVDTRVIFFWNLSEKS